jgi:toxin ParE1/3/4
MSRLLRTRQASLDLQRLWIYVAERNYPAADRLIRRLEKTFRLLEHHPYAGESVEVLRPNTRRIIVGSYVVLYEPLSDGIRLLRVVHSSRRIETLFEDENQAD